MQPGVVAGFAEAEGARSGSLTPPVLVSLPLMVWPRWCLQQVRSLTHSGREPWT